MPVEIVIKINIRPLEINRQHDKNNEQQIPHNFSLLSLPKKSQPVSGSMRPKF